VSLIIHIGEIEQSKLSVVGPKGRERSIERACTLYMMSEDMIAEDVAMLAAEELGEKDRWL
jgi:hypothetical protein